MIVLSYSLSLSIPELIFGEFRLHLHLHWVSSFRHLEVHLVSLLVYSALRPHFHDPSTFYFVANIVNYQELGLTELWRTSDYL